MEPRPALFLDRDGTLIEEVPYLANPSKLQLLPGVPEALKSLQDEGFLLLVVSNQSGVGRGYFTLDTVHECNRRMLELLGLPTDFFVDVCLATERPDEEPVYRKPSPRFILEMAEKHDLDLAQSYMVGDKKLDLETATNAGVRGVLVKTGKPITEEVRACADERDPRVFDDLIAFVDHLEES